MSEEQTVDPHFHSPLELNLWMMAYASRQPQLGGSTSAIYWAAAAIFHIRGAERNPSPEECRRLYELAQEHITRYTF